MIPRRSTPAPSTALWQFVDQLVKFGLRHESNSRTTPGLATECESRDRIVLTTRQPRGRGALLLAEVFDDHPIVRRKRASATQQLLDWQLEMLFTAVRCVRRHASNIGCCRAANR